jgi:hypothetical protein
MSNLSFARIMYGTSEGVRNGSGLSASTPSPQPEPSIRSSLFPASSTYSSLTLEDLLHKAWQVLSAKH